MAYCSEYGIWNLLEKSGPEIAPKHSMEVGFAQLRDSRSLRTDGKSFSISPSVMKPSESGSRGSKVKVPLPQGTPLHLASKPGNRPLFMSEPTRNSSEPALPKSARSNRRRLSIVVS